MTPPLRLVGVTQCFGDFVANEQVDLVVEAGEVVGLLGANGAGKTTAVREGLGLLRPTRGVVEHFGRRPSRATRRRIGYVPQGLGLWPDLTVVENLAFAAAAYGADPAAPDDLARVADVLVRDLALGLRRRVAFAAALAHDPALLVLDEPTSGVDVLSRSRLWERIRERAERGAAVLVTTHAMDEARQCDRLVVLARGRVVLQGTESEIVGGGRVVEVDGAPWAPVLGALDAAGLPGSLQGRRVRVLGDDEVAVRHALSAAGLDARVRRVPATLEETMVAVSTVP